MNFIQLVQQVVRLSGMADSGPSTVADQVGDYRKAIDYVQMAHAEIQNEYHDWSFLWRAGSFTTDAGVADYPGPSDLGVWDQQRIYVDGQCIHVYDHPDYCPQEQLSDSRPWAGVVLPSGDLRLIPAPDDSYPVSFEYFRMPRILQNNNDEPLIPSQFRMAIVGRALMMYGNYESAEEAKIQGSEIYQQFMDQLKDHQLVRRQQRNRRIEGREFQVYTP